MPFGGPPDRAGGRGTRGGTDRARGTHGDRQGRPIPREGARRPAQGGPHDQPARGPRRGRAEAAHARDRPRRSGAPRGSTPAAPTGGPKSPAGRPTRRAGAAPVSHHNHQGPSADRPRTTGPSAPQRPPAPSPTGGRGADRDAGREPPEPTGPPGRSPARPVAGRIGAGGFHLARIPQKFRRLPAAEQPGPAPLDGGRARVHADRLPGPRGARRRECGHSRAAGRLLDQRRGRSLMRPIYSSKVICPDLSRSFTVLSASRLMASLTNWYTLRPLRAARSR